MPSLETSFFDRLKSEQAVSLVPTFCLEKTFG